MQGLRYDENHFKLLSISVINFTQDIVYNLGYFSHQTHDEGLSLGRYKYQAVKILSK